MLRFALCVQHEGGIGNMPVGLGLAAGSGVVAVTVSPAGGRRKVRSFCKHVHCLVRVLNLVHCRGRIFHRCIVASSCWPEIAEAPYS